mmetsp:Transcript_111497/g.314816  ORF Transcript_111497/g.314816 Transcript_111497/m.314816 type:complete len:155 (+) Transcript_111497:9-473(+)
MMLQILFIILSTIYIINAKLIPVNNSTNTTLITANCDITQYLLAIEDDCGFESIHGLWPDPEESCTYCTDEKFDESKLTSETLDLMYQYWPTCYDDSTNEDFWSHEWEKHGTCTGMTQEGYFSEAIDLFLEYQSSCSGDCYICFTPELSYEGFC